MTDQCCNPAEFIDVTEPGDHHECLMHWTMFSDDELMKLGYCVDEGCPQHGTLHVCVNS